MSTGWGTGSCWYFGKTLTSPFLGKVFLCRNLGEVSSGAAPKLAFQFSIWQSTGAFAVPVYGTERRRARRRVLYDVDNNKLFPADGYKGNVVTAKVNKMTCTLSITTYSTDATSTREWYSVANDVKVDGGSGSDWLPYESFVKMIGTNPTNVPTATGHP